MDEIEDYFRKTTPQVKNKILTYLCVLEEKHQEPMQEHLKCAIDMIYQPKFEKIKVTSMQLAEQLLAQARGTRCTPDLASKIIDFTRYLARTRDWQPLKPRTLEDAAE